MIIRRFQPLIAALSIALLASDAVVGALGHSHGEAHSSLDSNHHCCHHGAGDGHQDEHSRPDESVPAPDDDCSLCRHFSQPVVLTTATVELIGSGRVETIEPGLTRRIATVSKLPHLARGPPAVGA